METGSLNLGKYEGRTLLKVSEAAEATGFATSYIWRLVARGDLPAVRVGRAVRIIPKDLSEFVLGRRTPCA